MIVIIIVEEEDLCVATDGYNGEGTSLVAMNTACHSFTCGIYVLGALCWSCGCWSHFLGYFIKCVLSIEESIINDELWCA